MSLADIPHSYETAKNFFEGRRKNDYRMVANNTRVAEFYGCTPDSVKQDKQVHAMGITFHNTRIIEFFEDGWIFLRPFHSVSTNARYDGAALPTLYNLDKTDRRRVADPLRWRDPIYPRGVPMSDVWGYRVSMTFRIAGCAQGARIVEPTDYVYTDNKERQQELRKHKRAVERVVKPYYAAMQLAHPALPDWKGVRDDLYQSYDPVDIEVMAGQADQIREQGLGIDFLSKPVEALENPNGLREFAHRFKASTPAQYLDRGDYYFHDRVEVNSITLKGDFWKK